MVRIRPTLLRKVRALLDAPAESADQLARDVITLIEEDRSRHEPDDKRPEERVDEWFEVHDGS